MTDPSRPEGPGPRHDQPGWGVGSSGGIEDGAAEPAADESSRRLLRQDHRFEQWVLYKGLLVLLLIAVLIWVRQTFLI
ncbi:hypothetical protein [Nakamurella leprariae]|uniref:Uncharacterized protein n=1 Tax=Nakamurella leprariae TaxID=2803911 RepID=A0A938Y876_9ACTN|nr:hypothetical protein [Nakamurella leprariae]MBM9467625.1 hypothetical protein [Nakamurella leprariae]